MGRGGSVLCCYLLPDTHVPLGDLLHNATVVNVEPIVFTIRCFAEGKVWGDEYKMVLTVQKMGDVGYVSGCHGEFSHSDYREFEVRMAEYGITKLEWSRKCQQHS